MISTAPAVESKGNTHDIHTLAGGAPLTGIPAATRPPRGRNTSSKRFLPESRDPGQLSAHHLHVAQARRARQPLAADDLSGASR
jgi:hypothetical protein